VENLTFSGMQPPDQTARRESHYHSLWLFEEWIYLFYLYAFGCVIIQFVSFSAALHLFFSFTHAFTPCKKVFCFVGNASDNPDKVCTLLFLQCWPCGSGFTTFQLRCMSRKQQFCLSQILLKASCWVRRKRFLCLLLYQWVPSVSVCVVLVLLLASTYNSQDTASNSKQRKINTDDGVDWYLNQILIVMFLNVTNLMLTYDK
jgi:hypothetical protein